MIKKNCVAFMKPLILFMVSLLFILGFRKNDTTRKVVIDFNLPIIDNTGNLLNVTDSLCIFYEEDLSLHKFSLVEDNFINNVFTKQVIKYQYFGFRKNEENGIFYDSLNVKQFRNFSVDSVLTTRAFKKVKFYDGNNKILVERLKQDDGQIIEKYVCKEKRDFTYPDTTFIYYSDKLKDIEYSLSRELDSLKSMKVQKMVMLYNAQQYAGMLVKFPERRLSFEMKEVPITNLEEIKSLFERLKEDYKALKK